MKNNSAVQIRQARPGDEAEIANVHLNSWREAYRNLLPEDFLSQLPLSFKRRKLFLKTAISEAQKYVLIVAETLEGIVGFACLAKGRDLGQENKAELQALYLFAKYKGQGVGFKLLSAGFNQMRERGFKAGYCWVLEGNPSIQFYKRTGAHFSGEEKIDIIGDQEVKELQFAWPTLNIGDYNWRPFSVPEVRETLKDFTSEWIIAGGCAIDLFLGRETRDHGDVDVLVKRVDQLDIQRALPDWDLWVADPPGTLRPWHKDEYLENGIQDVWCRRTALDPWRFQFMLFDVENENWIFKRDPSIRRPMHEAKLTTADGLHILAPEIQLLYKSKSLREKDNADFANALPQLSDEQKAWLKVNLLKVYGQTHEWLTRL